MHAVPDERYKYSYVSGKNLLRTATQTKLISYIILYSNQKENVNVCCFVRLQVL